METNEQLPRTGIVSILISSKPLNDHGGIDIGIYLIALVISTFNSLSQTFTAISICKFEITRGIIWYRTHDGILL
jgi:hypothetical protein